MYSATGSSPRRRTRSNPQQQGHVKHDEDLDFLGQCSDDNAYKQNRQAFYRDPSPVEEVVENDPRVLALYQHDQLRRRGRVYLGVLPFSSSGLAWHFNVQSPVVAFIVLFVAVWCVFKDFRDAFSAISQREPPNYNIPDVALGGQLLENPRRSWAESIADEWPFLLEQGRYGVKIAFATIPKFIAFQLILQFLVTLAQHLGANFLDGVDEVGFFPRYQANILSTQNLFGAGGFAAVTAHYEETFGFWNDWINGIWWTVTWHLPKFLMKLIWYMVWKGVEIPGEATDAEEWRERRAQDGYRV